MLRIGILMFVFLSIYSTQLFSQTKEERVQHIFDKIVQQVDDGREKPKLEFVYNEKKPSVNCGSWSLAWICANKGIIFFEEKLYDSLETYYKNELDDALSYFLGHEIAHYYKHTKDDKVWAYYDTKKYLGHGIAYSLAFSEFSGDSVLLEVEKEADIVGCFYSYLAGYHTRKIHKKLIVDFYDKFNLDDSTNKAAGYFPKAEREKVSDFVIDSMNKLIPIFEAGNYLYLIGSYEDVIKCYEHIAYYFPSKEILNNLGVCYAELALENDSADIAKYKFPFSFESRTEMTTIIAKSRRDAYADTARDYFQKSIARDPQYWTAYINLASVYVIEERMDAANAILDLIKYPATDTRIIADMNIVKGISAAIKGEENARQYFKLAKDGNKEYAEWNLEVMGGKGEKDSESVDLYDEIRNMKICGVSLKDFNYPEWSRLPFIITNRSFYRGNDSCGMFSIKFNKNKYKFLISIKKQDEFDIKNIANEFGSNYSKYKSRDFFYYCFKYYRGRYLNGVIFKIDIENQKINSFIVFRRERS
jgi:tetratricopeptide (TPR) repeat protein